jgi:hypothetical protein
MHALPFILPLFSFAPIVVIGLVAFFVFRGKKVAVGSGKPIAPNPNDFADWLSPMLVKELRQGMRARAFVISFLLLQGAMIFNVVLGLIASVDHSDTSFTTGFFWTMISVPLLMVMPMSGLGSVANEIKANTLDLIFLTRLSARRIIAGKWLAIVSQSALLVCAVLPYAVLRYFLGGVDLARDLITIALMLAASALLSSVMVASSPYQSKVIRSVFTGLLVFVLPYGGLFVFETSFRGSVVSGGWFMDWRSILALVAISVLFLILMLEIGASKIAPAAENHAARKRLIGFLFLATAFCVGSRPGAEPILLAAFILSLPICVTALCEEPEPIASICRPFVERGWIGRLAGRVFYPGWPSGVFFSALLLGGFYGLFRSRGMQNDPREIAMFLSLCGAIVLPIACSKLFMPRNRRTLAVFWAFQAVSSLLTIFAGLIDKNKHTEMRTIISVLPGCAFLHSFFDVHMLREIFPTFALISGIVTAICIGVLLIKSVKPFRELSVLEREAQVQVENRAASLA